MKILKTANYKKLSSEKEQKTKPVKRPSNYRLEWDSDKDLSDKLREEFSGEADKKKNDALDDKWNVLLNKDKKRQPVFAKSNKYIY